MDTPTAGTPKTSPPSTPQLAPQGPSQMLTALLARLPDATNRVMIDQVAVDFAFLNSKAARKRLIRVCCRCQLSYRSNGSDPILQFMSQTPKGRLDVLPHYSRLIATLNRYMPDVGQEVVANVSF